jgi:predicted NodU family carbamoyl transferase
MRVLGIDAVFHGPAAALVTDGRVVAAEEAARVLAGNGVVAWFPGRSEHGTRALRHRLLRAHPGDPATTERLNEVTGREQIRPVAPMVREDRAAARRPGAEGGRTALTRYGLGRFLADWDRLLEEETCGSR